MADLVRPGFVSPQRLLTHILENFELVAAVRELPPAALGKLIHGVGLEDAGEIVALASTEQLESVFDEDLWTRDDDWEERFDVRRFALWLSVFAEAGDEQLVRRLVELPLEFLTLAVARMVLVIDIDALAVEMSEAGDDLDYVEKALESAAHEEWEEFRLIAREGAGWDDLWHALAALDRDHHALLRRILERCAAMSSEWIDDNGGLYAVLTSDEMLEVDVRAARDDRRAAKGFVASSDARAFLELASRGDPAPRDAITRAYFRELAPEPAARVAFRRAEPTSRLTKLIEQASPRRSAALAPRRSRLLDGALAALFVNAPEQHAERLEELAYLANVLAAAAPPDQPLRPVEALEAAIAITNLGLELASGDERAPERVLATTHADQLFRKAWQALCCRTADARSLESPAASAVLSRHAR